MTTDDGEASDVTPRHADARRRDAVNATSDASRPAPGRMNRRRFLAYAIAATAGVVAVGTWRWTVEVGATIARYEPDDEPAFAKRLDRLEALVGNGDLALLLALPPALESAVAVGRYALPTSAAYRDESAVTARLRTTLLEPWRRDGGGHAELRDAYRAAVAGDHRAERVVILDGWVLAVTRVELCALAVLVHDRIAARVDGA